MMRLIIDHHNMKISISISNCAQLLLGKGDRCEFQSSLDTKSGEENKKSREANTKSEEVSTKSGEANGKSGEVRSVSGGFHPDPTKPQTPADRPKCKLR